MSTIIEAFRTRDRLADFICDEGFTHPEKTEYDLAESLLLSRWVTQDPLVED